MMEDRADDQTPGASSGCSEPDQVTVVYQQENAAPMEFLDDKIVMASPTELKLSEITEVADIPQESISSVGEETKILGEVVSLCDTTLEATEPPTESKEGTADIDISIEIEDQVVTNPELPLLKGLKVELTDIVGELGESMHNSTVDMQNINEQFANLKSEILNEVEQQKPTRKRQTKVHVEKPVKYESLTHNAELARFAATLRAENKLMDVSLCCGELVVTAHRLVLVAYSKLLYSIIGADQTCNYVSLDNFAIPSSVLTGILDFMYTGVIHLPDSEKTTVLEAAKTLQVSSLIEILEPAVVKRKRGRPSKAEVHIASVTKSKVGEQSAAPPPRKLARAKQRRVIEISPVQPPAKKRGRPRKSEAAPVMVVDAAEEGKPEPATSLELPPEPESDGDDYVPDDSDNPDGEEEEPIAEDGDYSPKKKPGKRGRPRKSEAAKKTTTTKAKAKAISTKVKKVLTEEEKERLRILREKRANRPKPIKTDDGQFKCPIEGCLYISRTDSFIYNHIRSHSDERPFPCTLCEKRFKSKKHLDVHIRVHTGERPYACEVCGKRFKATKHRNRHRRVHTGEKVAFCEECGKGFSSNNQLSRHIMAVHRKERPHKCEHGDCGYAAADRSTLRQHMLQHLRDPNNPEACKDILCEVCGKGFLSANSLRLHRLSHMGEDLQCQDCDYITKYKSALESHVMRRHNKTMAGLPAEKRWRCDQCLYSCFTEAEFNMHMMKHRGEKPHKCPICDFATVDKGTLKKHVRHHTGEMPFVCKICTKAFSSQSGLARHNRIHTGIKPHKCDECDKAYADKKSLKAHKFTHLNIKPFECHMCVYSCVKKEYLFRHIQKTHGDESVPEHLRPNPEHKKYRPRNLFQGQQLDVSINQDGSDDTANVVVEEAHPDTEVLEYTDRGATHAQVAAYANVTDIQGLVEGFQGGPPPLYPISHFAGNN